MIFHWLFCLEVLFDNLNEVQPISGDGGSFGMPK